MGCPPVRAKGRRFTASEDPEAGQVPQVITGHTLGNECPEERIGKVLGHGAEDFVEANERLQRIFPGLNTGGDVVFKLEECRTLRRE